MAEKYIPLSVALSVAAAWCPDDDGSVGKTGDLREMLDELEAIEPAAVRPVVRGEWIAEIDGEIVSPDSDGCPGRSCHCSVCGDWLDASDEYAVKGRFCPNCGADMRPKPPEREVGV